MALILSSFREIELYSEQSLVIITAEEGPPQSEPEIVRAVAVDHTRISISWEPGLLKNGPILFYVLQIKESQRDTYFTIKVSTIPLTGYCTLDVLLHFYARNFFSIFFLFAPFQRRQFVMLITISACTVLASAVIRR